MPRRIITFILCFFFASVAVYSQRPPSFQILVGVDRHADTLAINKVIRSLPGAIAMKPLLPAQSGPSFLNVKNRLFIMRVNALAEVAFFVQYLKSTNLFSFVEADGQGTAATTADSPVFPTDEFFNRQWSHNNDGTFLLAPSTVDADADITDAWAITNGNENIIVAVLDSGIKTDHPEFKNRLWQNTDEIPGNAIDDDNNGYIDDVQGWNMIAGNSAIEDDAGHGTHVAGILGASGNNSIGYAGVDWHCKIMICKVLDENLVGYYSHWISAIHYAVDNGANIINMSVGGKDYSHALEEAIQYANDHNVAVVASMQNQNNSDVYYPAGFANVIAVGSTDPDDRRSKSFGGTHYGSNYGDHLDIVAPGNFIYGLSNIADTEYNTVLSGTSQAAPLVSGVMALLWAAKPYLTIGQLESILLETAEDEVGSREEDTPGWDRYYGYGRVNANLALQANEALLPDKNKFYVYPNPSTGELHIQIDQNVALVSALEVYNNMGQVIYSSAIASTRIIDELFSFHNLPSGVYRIKFQNAMSTRCVRWLKI